MSESVSEWSECGVCEWGMWEWVKWSEVKRREVKWREVKWVSGWASERVSDVSEWVSEWVRAWVGGWVGGWVSEWVSEFSIYLSIDRSVYLSMHPSINQSIYLLLSLSISLSIYQTCLSIHLSIYPYIRISIYLPINRSIYPSIYLSCYLSIYLSIYLAIYLFNLSINKIHPSCRTEWVSEWVSELVSEYYSTPAKAHIWLLGSAHCPTPATQQRRSPKGRQGVHPTPWQCTLSHACHAKASEPQGTPGRTSDPLAVHIVPRLPRKSVGAPRDARAYIRPLGSAHCPTPATQKRRSPKGRQGVHPTPWQCTLSHACHAKAANFQGTPGRTSRAHCPIPATQKQRSPKGRQGVHLTPWQCTLSHACHATASEPQGTPGRTDPLAVHIVPPLPRKSGGAPRDARAYIRPLGSAHCPTATQKRRSPKGRQGVHPTPWQYTLSHACHAKAAEPQGTPERTSDPLAVHIVPRLPRNSVGAPRDARTYIRPLGSAHCPTPATQKRRSPKGRQGVHPTPWQCTLSHACHAKEAEPQGTPGRTSNPLAVHIVPRVPRKSPLAVHIVPRLPRNSGGAPRDARAYIRPLGSAHCPTPATQKQRSPKGRQGVHPTPWQCTLSHACHAKAAEPQGTPGRTSDPLAVHIVPRLPRKSSGAPRDARAYIRSLGSAHCPTPATQKRRSPRDATLSHACHAKDEWGGEWVSQWVSGWVREWVSEYEMRWDGMGWDEMRWDEVSELSEGDEMRWDEMRWDEMRWDETRRDETRRDETRWDEVRWGEVRWDEVRWGEWVSEWVMSEWVWGGAAGGRGADTELKTKTPHVNVGNNNNYYLIWFRAARSGHCWTLTAGFDLANSSPNLFVNLRVQWALLDLNCWLRRYQLVANLFINFRVLWALLDLNLGFCHLGSTAGPQPGTRGIQ